MNTKTKKKIKLSLLIVFVISLIGGSVLYIKLNNKKSIDVAKINYSDINKESVSINEELTNTEEYIDKHEDLTNINECTEEFMNNYFEKIAELNKNGNKDNILLVGSKEKIEETFGATEIVECPNNQYILQYNSGEEKNRAYEELKKLDNIIVEKNKTRTITGYNSWGIEKTGLDYAT